VSLEEATRCSTTNLSAKNELCWLAPQVGAAGGGGGRAGGRKEADVARELEMLS